MILVDLKERVASMNFWGALFMICSNQWVLSGVTYIGLILTIYFSVYRKHKKIKFVVARNGSNYIIALWNARDQTIFREDVSYFYAYGNVNCNCDIVHMNDPEIPLEFKVGEESIQLNPVNNIRFNRHVKKIDFSFDFLPKRKGYIIHIDNKQKEGYHISSLLIKGRIRGERCGSIHGDTYCIGKRAVFRTVTYTMIGTGLFLLIIGVILQISTGIYMHDDVMWLNGLFGLILFSLPFSLVCYLGYINSIPLDILCKYYKYIRRFGYQDITHEVNKIS